MFTVTIRMNFLKYRKYYSNSLFFYRISQLFNLSTDNNEPTVETKRVAHCSLLLLILVWTALCAIAIFAADLLYSGEWWILLLVNHFFKIYCKLRNSNSLPRSNHLQDVNIMKPFLSFRCAFCRSYWFAFL